MKCPIGLVCIVFLVVAAADVPANPVSRTSIVEHGAKGDGVFLNTKAINAAVNFCAEKGGGTVVIPAGTFLSGTIHLKSNVTLHLEENAVLKGSADLEHYDSCTPSPELQKKYDVGTWKNWNRSLIQAVGVRNTAVTGPGKIDGCHVFDPDGEEKMRGPHAMFFMESSHLRFEGFTVENASNYGVMAVALEDVVFKNLRFEQGWDGIHVRGGNRMVIHDCEFFTGDDAIAGGYWNDVEIADCRINSSCNGIRLIMPAENFVIRNCRFFGPGRHPHRTSKERNRTNMLSAVILQPGGWCYAPGRLENIHLHDIEIENVDNPLMVVLNRGNHAGTILVERFKARNISRAACSFESWTGGVFDRVVLQDMDIEYRGNPEASSDASKLGQPPADSRSLPCWALFVRNVKEFCAENMRFRYLGSDPRPAMLFDNCASVRFEKVEYTGIDDKTKTILKHCGETKNIPQ